MARNKRGNVYVPAQVLMRREGREVLKEGKKEDLKNYAERYGVAVESNATAEDLRKAVRSALGMTSGAPRTATTAVASGTSATRAPKEVTDA